MESYVQCPSQNGNSIAMRGNLCIKRVCFMLSALVCIWILLASYPLSGKNGLSIFSLLNQNRHFVINEHHSDTTVPPCSLAADQQQGAPAAGNSRRINFKDIHFVVTFDNYTQDIVYTARNLPNKEELLRYARKTFSSAPSDFLLNFKNPCWWQPYDRSTGSGSGGGGSKNPYITNVYYVLAVHLRPFFRQLFQTFDRHLLQQGKRLYRMRCLPYFYIIGQPKCGTTDLYERLKMHPEVTFAIRKEPHWWSRNQYGYVNKHDLPNMQYKCTFEDYLDLFDNATRRIKDTFTEENGYTYHRIINGEASASTMWDNNAWETAFGNTSDGEPPFLVQDFIHAVQPEAKLIVMLRNPTERLYSDYLYFMETNKSAEAFHEKVVESVELFLACAQSISFRACLYNYDLSLAMPVRLRIGFYVVYLLEWLSVFRQDQILILKLEDHARHPSVTMEKVFSFLGLGAVPKHIEAAMFASPPYNSRRLSDKILGPMLPATRLILNAVYAPFNKKLAELQNDNSFLWEN
ncbi:carbohydrate sulfotransferase 15 [Lethenteron reissneri]|uniref:carbohydrate sulfotransferase 15 n=1 Tax=Lethenteron reissneri TaxID=7753 RepID=UPI002AB73C1D|nr:carbohydrate sulfotransferase 15 [Lethenteron reissneri]XP_061409005.1 carbohydrate sulfotransferase 15 [Lethenteron reissneri]XP_061409006.1 carbohydrate sulfotransferase 15 [Lethenteron reissneri]